MAEAIVQVIFQGHIIETVRLNKDIITVGRAAENDVVLPNLGVSREHCKIVKDEDGKFFIEDNGSSNGTQVNGVRVNRSPLYSGDEIQVLKHKLVFQITEKGVAGFFKSEENKTPDLWMGDRTIFAAGQPPPPAADIPPETFSEPTPPPTPQPVPPPPPVDKADVMDEFLEELQGMEFGIKVMFEDKVVAVKGLGQEEITIGREAGNGIVIDNLAVSRNHARIIFHDGQYIAEDMESSNGIRINGVNVKRSPLYPGDEVMLGKHTLVFNSTKRLLSKISPEDIRKTTPSAPWHTGTYQALKPPGQDAPVAATPEQEKETLPWDGKYAVRVALKGRELASYVIKKRVTCIGRLAENDIVIDNIGISRLHAKIIIEDNGQCYVEDEDSANGILVNNLPVKRSPLYPGDEIMIVKHLLVWDLAHKAQGGEQAVEGGQMSKEAWRLEHTFAVSTKEQQKKIKEWAERAARLKSERAKQTPEQPPQPAQPESISPVVDLPSPPPARDPGLDEPTPPSQTPVFDEPTPPPPAEAAPPAEPTPHPVHKHPELMLPLEARPLGMDTASIEQPPATKPEPPPEKTPTQEIEAVSPKALLIFEDGLELEIGQDELLLGKGDDVNIKVAGKWIKKLHATISPEEDGGWKIVDKGFMARVKINGKKVRSALLNNGDEISLGELSFKFLIN